MTSDRIKALRKALAAEYGKCTMEDFGERIGVSRDVIANLEYGRVEPSELIIKSICRTYDVNETWLRTGEGEMFNPRDPDDKLAEFMGGVLREDIRDSVKKQIIDLLAHLPPEAWTAIAAVMKERAAKYREDDAGNKKED